MKRLELMSEQSKPEIDWEPKGQAGSLIRVTAQKCRDNGALVIKEMKVRCQCGEYFESYEAWSEHFQSHFKNEIQS